VASEGASGRDLTWSVDVSSQISAKTARGKRVNAVIPEQQENKKEEVRKKRKTSWVRR
jgi:hypothetical protein